MLGMFRKKKEIKISNKTESFIQDAFLKLTSRTYPYGFEEELVTEMTKSGLFPKDLQKDKHGNYFYKIGESRTVFASHFDTACKDSTGVVHVIEGNMIKTDGKSILGADDKAGVSVMLYMIKNNIPGLYYFFIGEEVGCVGSKLASKYGDFKGNYDRIISFDRRDVDSVITYQSSSRCCSDAFADNLAKELNKSGLKYKKDDTGVYTDSAEFTDIIPECTNLSVGYYREHTHNESQDIKHLEKLAEACLLVNWESLVTKRDMTKTEYKSWSYPSSYRSSGTGKYNSSSSWNNSKTSNWRNRDWNDNYKKTYGEDDDFYDEDDGFDDEGYPNRYKSVKKTRRGGSKPKPRQFYDAGGELIELEVSKGVKLYYDKEEYYKLQRRNSGLDKTDPSHYEWIMSKFIGEQLTFQELDIIKDQYLDMSNPNDQTFYIYLIEYINEHGQ